MEYPDKPVGQLVDYCCIQWKRTNRRDADSTYSDNYYYMPAECY